MMTKDEIMKVLDAMNYAISPSGTFWVKKHNEAKQILQAALAEPSEAVAILDVSMQEHDRGQSLAPASPAFKFARTVALPIAKDLPLGVYKLFAHPAPSNHLDEIAKVLHYPDCWDMAAYPTLEDAIIEAKSWAHCTNEDCQCPTKETP